MLPALLLSLSVSRAGDVPIDEQPRQLMADDHDRFYIDQGATVVRWTTTRDRVFSWRAPEGWSTTSISHAIAPNDGTIHTLQEVSKSKCVDKECSKRRTDWQLLRWTCEADGACKSEKLGSWSKTSGDTSWTGKSAALRVTEQGTPLLAVTTTRHTSKKTTSETDYRCGRSQCTAAEWGERWYAEMKVPPRWRIGEGDHLIRGPGLPDASVPHGSALLEAMAAVDTRHVYDREGRPHVWFHDSADRSFSHRYVDETSGSPRVVEESVDEPESGASNAAVRMGESGMLAFHYFFRNSYYKGVKATWFPDADGPAAWSVDIDNGRDDNPGWRLQAAATPQGRVMVGYQRDPKNGSGYRLRLFDSVDAVHAAEVAQPEGWEVHHKAWSGLVGAGVHQAMWLFGSGAPTDEDFEGIDGADRYLIDASYDVRTALLTEVSTEARIGRVSLGASYARQLLEDTAGDLGASGPETDRLFGMLGIDRIIKYHDIRVVHRRGRMVLDHALSPRDAGDSPVMTRNGHLETAYERTDVYLLNTWRVRYGIVRQQYDAVLPFYAWSIAEGATSYQFAGSFTAPAKLTDTALTIGYSQLDYAAKFENKVSRLFIDGDVGLGFSKAEFDEPVQVTSATGEAETVEHAIAVLLPYNVEVGYLLLRRSHALHGVGWYARGGYRAEGSFAGVNGKPGDKDEAAESATTNAAFNKSELRHGPFLSAGVVF